MPCDRQAPSCEPEAVNKEAGNSTARKCNPPTHTQPKTTQWARQEQQVDQL